MFQIGHLMLPDQIRRMAGDDDRTMVDDRYPGTEISGLLHMVRGIEDGHALLVQAAKQVEDHISGLDIDANCGLIQEENTRMMEDACDQVDSSFHATGKGADLLVPELGQSELVEEFKCPCFQVVSGQTEHISKKAEIFPGRQLWKQCNFLRHHADETLNDLSIPGISKTADGKVSACRVLEPAQDRKCGGFTRSVGAEQTEDLALLYGQGHIPDCR